MKLKFSGRDEWKLTAANRSAVLVPARRTRLVAVPGMRGRFPSPTCPLGKHYFQVRAMDRNCNIDPNPARLEFAVVLPWYARRGWC